MKPLGYYSSRSTDSDVLDEMMLRYGPTLDQLSDESKLNAVVRLAQSMQQPGATMPSDLADMMGRLSNDGKFALMEAMIAQLRESDRKQRVGGRA